MKSERTSIEQNEVRLYPNNSLNPYYFNVLIKNEWFSKDFLYKVYEDRVVFRRPTLDYKKFPTKGQKTGTGWVFYLTLPNQENRRLTILDEDINEDEAILYL